MSKHEIKLRINVTSPLAGVSMQVQEGKDRLLPPCDKNAGRISFEFQIIVDLSSGTPNFLGKFAQGSKDSRFIYVNSGSYAGQAGTSWNRRAKIPLFKITTEQVKQVIDTPGSKLEITISGIGRDGGPVCASIPSGLVNWQIIN